MAGEPVPLLFMSYREIFPRRTFCVRRGEALAEA